MTHRTLRLLLAMLLSADALSGQGIHVSIGGGLYVNPDGGPGSTDVGPTIQVGLAIPLTSRLDLTLDAGFARTDFNVGVDEVHRNVNTVLVGLEASLLTGRTTLRLGIAGGVIGEDDVSETDPAFTSSTRWSGALSPGLEIGRRVGDRLELFFGVRDDITGLFNAVFDPSESAVRHRTTTVVGLRIGSR